jgi:hypothetical protein
MLVAYWALAGEMPDTYRTDTHINYTVYDLRTETRCFDCPRHTDRDGRLFSTNDAQNFARYQ